MNMKGSHLNNKVCPHGKCSKRVNPSNSATNFLNPALAVELALKSQAIKPNSSVLEVGSGNLRNSLFLLKSVSGIKSFAYELEDTVARFADRYELFKSRGGNVVKSSFGKRKYDIVICTFVLETICPYEKRKALLKKIRTVLKTDGTLIASFRGYPGVRGSQYRSCPMREGLITPLNTFIKPHSIPEALDFLKEAGFRSTALLQKYKVEKPENIHILAYQRGSNGKVMA
jgi:SAM-dependent methyltransferase